MYFVLTSNTTDTLLIGLQYYYLPSTIHRCIWKQSSTSSNGVLGIFYFYLFFDNIIAIFKGIKNKLSHENTKHTKDKHKNIQKC